MENMNVYAQEINELEGKANQMDSGSEKDFLEATISVMKGIMKARKEAQRLMNDGVTSRKLSNTLAVLPEGPFADYLRQVLTELHFLENSMGEASTSANTTPPASHRPKPYTIEKRRERTFAKNAAKETTYSVHFTDQWRGKELSALHREMHEMFTDVLEMASSGIEPNDVGRVIIEHDALNDAVVVPLRPWSQLNAVAIMDTVAKVLNSHQHLQVNDSFHIHVGRISVPKGSGSSKRVTTLSGPGNSLHMKTSIVQIVNSDLMCLARSIGVAFARVCIVSDNEWRDLKRLHPNTSNADLLLKFSKCSQAYYRHVIASGRKEQTSLALELSRQANVPIDRPATIDDISKFEDVVHCRILVVSAALGNKFVRTGDNTNAVQSPFGHDKTIRPNLYLYLTDDHHFHTISKINGFFGRSYFCEQCLVPYHHNFDHSCQSYCITCKTPGCFPTDAPLSCKNCHMECRSLECFNRHCEKPEKTKNSAPPSQCEKFLRCVTCKKVIDRTKRNLMEHPHECGEYECRSCNRMVVGQHHCYLRTIIPKPSEPKYIFYDFETFQTNTSQCSFGYQAGKCDKCTETPCNKCKICINCRETQCGKFVHTPNYVVAQTVCGSCIDDPIDKDSLCNKCGTRCHICNPKDSKTKKYKKPPCQNTCGFRQFEASGDGTLKRFGAWLFSETHEHFTAIAHNARGFDNIFLLEYLITQSQRPQTVIYSGSKIMYMKVCHGIRILDSLNFLNTKLSALPSLFDLTELKKGWFPHKFNTPANQTYIGPYPDPQFYGVDQMSTKDRQAFLEWHSSKDGEIFNFREEMSAYCVSDVDILRSACLKFRALLMGITHDQIDPFQYVTIASVCMAVYRCLFLKEEHVAQLKRKDGCGEVFTVPYTVDKKVNKYFIDDAWLKAEAVENNTPYRVVGTVFESSPLAQIPGDGYTPSDTYSKVSIQWLEWEMAKRNIFIQHALNGVEFQIPGTKYRADGYCPATNTIFELMGCIWHGCPECYKEDRQTTKHPRTSQSLEELYALTLKKRKFLENAGYGYVEMWECQFRRMVEVDHSLTKFVANLDIQERLDPRDSFYGGRTNACKLLFDAKPGEEVKYVDFTSLYPTINKYARYPVGHPEIITSNFVPLDQYFGICKVKILPPKGLYHPVLPYRSQGKLKFPLCRTCADTEQTSPCQHASDKRSITDTWVIAEVLKAIEKGYTLMHVYEVYHFSKTAQYDRATKSGGLFSEYVNTFLKLKQEASDFPKWVKSEQDKQKYVSDYYDAEGVHLNPADIKKNPPLRSLAKLCLNSYWGKFGQRLNMKQSEIIHDSNADDFFKILTDPSKEVVDFHILNDQYIQLSWLHKKAFLPTDTKTNIFIASFTTAWARLKLYDMLDFVGERALYYDTDSIIYVSRPGQPDIPLGDHLGQMTDELDGNFITHFASGGPKNYAYRTSDGKEVCKVRGFSLNFTNSQKINFSSVRDLVVQHPRKRKADPSDPHPTKLFITNDKIVRGIHQPVLFNRKEEKNYSIVYTKRVLHPNFDTTPYGY